jgi:hypothetical protein
MAPTRALEIERTAILRLLLLIFVFHVGDERISSMSNTADGEEAIRQASTATAGIQTTPVSISFQYFLVLLYKQFLLQRILTFTSVHLNFSLEAEETVNNLLHWVSTDN